MRNFDGIFASGANLAFAKHDYVSAQNAEYDQISGYRGKFSLCYFQGIQFNGTDLREATMLGSVFSEQTDWTDTNVDGLLLLAARHVEGVNINREWLQQKHAINADKAITSLEELRAMLNNKIMPIDRAEFYRKRINTIYGLLNSMRLRAQTNLEIKPNWLEMLKFAKIENLNILQNAYFELDKYILQQVCQSGHTDNIDTLNRMQVLSSWPKTLTFVLIEDEKDKYFLTDRSSQKYQQRAEKLADILVGANGPQQFTLNILFNSHNELAIIFNKLAKEVSHTRLHIIVNQALSQSDLTALLNLLASSNCPKDLRIDLKGAIDIKQYYQILVAITNNSNLAGLNMGFHVNSDDVALAILRYAQESILHANRINLCILSCTYDLSYEVMTNIKHLQAKISALACLTLLQGHRDESHILSILPDEILSKIFEATLPKKTNLEQKNNYLNNIWHSPVGSLFFLNKGNAEINSLVKKYKLPDSRQVNLEKALRNAANNNCVADLKLLIKYVRNINAPDNNPISGKTALHWAAEKNHSECIKLLLAAGANLNAVDAKGIKVQIKQDCLDQEEYTKMALQ